MLYLQLEFLEGLQLPSDLCFVWEKKNQIYYGKSNYENYKKISMKLSFFDWNGF